jgi:two-component sensor histidine kinase
MNRATVPAFALNMDLDLTPAMVSPMRCEIETRLAGVLGDEDAEARVAMAVHELLENAAKYSSDGKARLRIELAGPFLHLTLQNNSAKEHIDQLLVSFAEMRQHDPFSHYFTLMRRNAKIGSISRLGLARVRAEGEMEVALAVEGQAVTITASMPVPTASDGL